jgi:hypothetical protein
MQFTPVTTASGMISVFGNISNITTNTTTARTLRRVLVFLKTNVEMMRKKASLGSSSPPGVVSQLAEAYARRELKPRN